MNRIISLIACLLLLPVAASAFDPPPMHPADRLIVTLFSDAWQNVPEGMELTSIQRGVNIKLMQDMPLGRSQFSLAAGLGITSHNLYSDHLYTTINSGDFGFMPIAVDYKKNKLSMNYLEVPVQLRYRSRNLPKSFRIYAGFEAGYLINAHTKYEGKSIMDSSSGRTTKFKEHKLGMMEDWRMNLSAMVGYGSVNFSVAYSLSSIFEGAQVSDMQPISLGVSLILF